MFVSNYSLGSQICIPDIKQQESSVITVVESKREAGEIQYIFAP